MYKLLKNNFFINYLFEVLVHLNQAYLAWRLKLKDRVFIIPQPGLHKGNIEHYYHFIFDLVLPLQVLISKMDRAVIFQIKSFGPLTGILKEIFGQQIEIIDSDNSIYPEVHKYRLLGMNPLEVRLQKFNIGALQRFAYDHFNIRIKQRNKILLIERSSPPEYYLKDATNKGAGISRRSIRNHSEVYQFLNSSIKPEYELVNIKLEQIPFAQQVQLFNESCLVIAQHGAGLTNILWMNQAGVVLEFGYNKKRHFERLAQALNISHFLMNFEQEHITIAVDLLGQYIGNVPSLSKFFNTSSPKRQ